MLKTNNIATGDGAKQVPTNTIVEGTAKAWASYTTETTSAIRDSFNVSSITDLGVGDTLFTLAAAFATAISYSVYGSNSQFLNAAWPQTATTLRTTCGGSGFSLLDTNNGSWAAHGDMA